MNHLRGDLSKSMLGWVWWFGPPIPPESAEQPAEQPAEWSGTQSDSVDLSSQHKRSAAVPSACAELPANSQPEGLPKKIRVTLRVHTFR